ncbi:tetratricopeptide repeat protein 38-like isoform X2 [Varroa destructor]|uniref:Tetratricopeptide repeat protein 38 n=1 Tax=Varroa destructor TaxID=109461 RepID=A0A7M7K1Z8_VARDE|nr:tetratricopeptide repeat protein 38-like isoform X2 [Varroa destructor]
MPFHVYRDIAGWQSQNLPITTTSNEASRMFDSCISQFIAWREDEYGLGTAMEKMVSADPEFVLGKVLVHTLNLIGTGDSGKKNPKIIEELKFLRGIAKIQGVSERERLHLEAALRLAEGSMHTACEVWEKILQSHPTDMLAIKAAHDCYFYLGKQQDMRTSIERVMPKWKTDLPLYSYLYGMQAFGLCETGSYEKASQMALRGLELNRNDAWATHANAHVFEMTTQPSQGISFMSRTVADWQPCGLLACHNFWHWALYHIEKGETEAAIDLFDSEVEKRCGSGSMLDYVDGASLLYRLELEGINVGRRWTSLYAVTKEHLYDHILVFNDAHFAMTLLGLKDKEHFNKFQGSLNSVEDVAEIDNTKITTLFGKKLIQAMKDYSEVTTTKKMRRSSSTAARLCGELRPWLTG